MKALSIREPWASLILAGIKPVENRSWPTPVRGRVLIHTGKKFDNHAFFDLLNNWHAYGLPSTVDDLLRRKTAKGFSLGGIVGKAKLVDVLENSKSHWFSGKYGLVLRDAKPLPFIPCKGQLGIYYPDADLIAELRKKGIIK